MSRQLTLVTWSKSHVTLWMVASHFKSAPYLVWCSWDSAGGDMYLICHVTSHDHLIERACKLMGWNSLCYAITVISLVTINIAVVKMFLVCHVTSREHMFKGLCEFMGWSPSRWVTILPCLVDIGLVQVEIYLACHVNLQNHVIEGSRNFMLGAFHVYITNLPSLVVIGIVLVEMFEKWSSKPTKLQGQVTITIGTPQGKSPSYQNWLLYGHCGLGDTFLVRHTILQGEVIKRSSDFIGKSPSR